MQEKIKVLVVDDNSNFATLLSDHINEQDDLEVIGIANNGIKAVEQIVDKSPDLVVLDIIMPYLDGLGVLEKINTLSLDKKPKIIVLSAVGQDNIARRAIDLGANYYIIKPFDFNVFLNRLRQMIYSKPDIEIGSSMTKTEPGVFAKKIQSESQNIEIQITEIINKIGVPPHVKGYQYLRTAIQMVYDDVSFLSKVTIEIYPGVAKKFNTTPSRVERAIRNAIEISLSRGNTEYVEAIFGQTLTRKKGKLTNSEFIAIIADRIRVGV